MSVPLLMQVKCILNRFSEDFAGRDIISRNIMSKQAETGVASRRRYTSSTKVVQKKRKNSESRNTNRIGRSTSANKERKTSRYEKEGDENTTIERTDSGICVFPEEKHLNGNQGARELQVVTGDFQMLKLFDKESIDDSLSMISVNSRPTSAVTDFAEEMKLGSDEEFLSLENLSVSDEGQMRKISTESNTSDLEISVDNGSPRIQVSQLRGENNNIVEKAENDHLDNTNLTLRMETVEIGDEKENNRATVKTAWELNEKFLLTTDFPAGIWDEKINRKTLNARRRSSDLLNASFPPLSSVPELRRGSFPISSLMSSSSPRELPLLSGRQCKVKLPTHFPGMPSLQAESDSESKSSDDEQLDDLLLEKGQKARRNDQKLQKNQLNTPRKQGNNLAISTTKSSPLSSRSHSPMESTETLAINAASTEYLAARVVTQLDCALQETVNVSKDEVTTRASCVTPNLMPRRYSSLSFRPTTSNYFGERTNSLILPSVHNECSKSLPNLTDTKTRRMFVTFDKDLPRAKVVDLEGESDLSEKCRLINHRLSSEDALVKAMLDKKIKKKTMVRKWVLSSTTGTLTAE